MVRPMQIKASALVAALLALASAPERLVAAPIPSVESADLARGAFSSMHMTLTKTLLKIEVATIDIRVDKPTQTRFAEVGRGKAYSEPLERALADVAMGAQNAVLQMQLKRNVSLDRWMGVVRESLEKARRAGLITAASAQRVSDSLPRWFASLKERGFEKGDRILYLVAPDAVRTVVVSREGGVLVDMTERDREARRIVLGSYFAPGSEFREPLLRSLFAAPR